MYVETVRNQYSGSCVLLREAFRVDGKVRKRTIANLTNWPPQVVEGLRRLLRGESVEGPPLDKAFDATCTRPHGHVAAVLGTLEKLGLHRVLSSRRRSERDLVVAMIVARLLDPRSKLATSAGLQSETRTSTLGEMLELERVREDGLYEALDWLHSRQARIEGALAKKHLAEGGVVLYDLSSTYFEGRMCPLAALGHSRDGKRGKRQINFGLLCNSEGCPVSVEVFPGNAGDPATLKSQVTKLRERFGLERVVLVGDRGMITDARIREDLRGVEGLDWITCLRSSKIKELVLQGSIQLTLFDEVDLAEIQSPDYPGERLIACRNPALAEERARKREALLAATEEQLDKIVAATRRNRRPLVGKDKIGLRVGKVLGKYKVAKHFRLEIAENEFSYARDEEKIAAEAALDGIYVVRTSVPVKEMDGPETVATYKSLARVERAFRSTKTVDLKVRPIYHWTPDRVRAHVFLCMLAYYVEWHMRRALAPLLFDDEHKEQGSRARESVVAPAQASPSARRKARTKKNSEGMAVQSFQGLLRTLSTIAKTRIEPRIPGALSFDKVTLPSPLQQRALDLLDVRL